MSIFVFCNQQKNLLGLLSTCNIFLFCFMHLHFFFFFFSYLFCAFFSERTFHYHLHVKQKQLTPLGTIVRKSGNILYPKMKYASCSSWSSSFFSSSSSFFDICNLYRDIKYKYIYIYIYISIYFNIINFCTKSLKHYPNRIIVALLATDCLHAIHS